MQTINTCCQLTSSHDSCDDRIFYKESVSLRRAGYDVVIVAPTDNVPKETHGVRFHGYTNKEMPRRFGLGRLYKAIVIVRLGFKVNADIYHCHEPDLLFPAMLIRLGQLMLRRKRVFIIHEIRDFYLQEAYLDQNLSFFEKLRLSLRECWDRFVEWRCDQIIGVEETKVERPLSYGITADRISVIENYVRLELFQAQPKIFNPSDFVVAYEGGLSYSRGIDKLAQACVVLGSKIGIRVRLVLAGRWSSQEEEIEFTSYCAENRKFLELHTLGWLPHISVPQVLAQADICCTVFFSKRYDKVLSGKAGPIKLYEYMACGKPVIASNLGALRYTIEKAQCGILVDVAGGASAIATALEFYYTHPEYIKEHGENARRAAEKFFNWEIAEKKLLDIYARLLSQKRR